MTKHNYNNIFNENNEHSYYWAGFLAADGSVNKNNLYLQLAEKDVNHLNKLKDLISNTQNLIKYITKLNDKEFTSYRLNINNKDIVNSLNRFNIIQNKTKIYSLPILDESLIKHFIRGYFDGDGCFKVRKYKNYNQLTFSLAGNYTFLEEVKNVLTKYCDLTKDKQLHKHKRSDIYYLEYSGNVMVKRIFDFLYKDNLVCLDRKYNKGYEILYK